ncbi:MAG: transketolase, partial [Burkholderiales bacterium]
GWEVREIDGHDIAEIVDTLDTVLLTPDRPTAIIAHTVKGKGVDFAEDTYVWHSNSVNDEILAKALAQLSEPGAGSRS